MKTLDDILNNSAPEVHTLALRALHYNEQLHKGMINQAEYDSLVAQLLDVKELLQVTKDAETKQDIAVAIQIVAKFLGRVI